MKFIDLLETPNFTESSQEPSSVSRAGDIISPFQMRKPRLGGAKCITQNHRGGIKTQASELKSQLSALLPMIQLVHHEQM